jgi:hypothetical protein
MTELSDLFAEGTAPEEDPAFALRVAADIRRARLGVRLGALALPAALVLALSAAAFLAAGVLRPVLAELTEGTPQVMGVPAPVVMAALAAGLALAARRYVLSR